MAPPRRGGSLPGHPSEHPERLSRRRNPAQAWFVRGSGPGGALPALEHFRGG